MSALQNQVRIIGGKWRGRKIHFPAVAELRPTGDKIRETVFNWLQLPITSSNCLDLFAGAGAFGFEAISRGAGSVVMVDYGKEVFASLVENKKLLGATEVEIFCMQIPSENLRRTLASEKFDIVFIDPPFRQGLVSVACDMLVSANCLAEGALLYIETERELDLVVPEGWEIIRAKKAGKVRYYLVRVITSPLVGEVKRSEGEG